MKRSIVISILLCLCISALSQQKSVIVKLKTGTEITGVLKDLDPSVGVVLTIAGIDKTISMSDIAEIKEVENSGTKKTSIESDKSPTRDNPLIIKDMAQYPETINVRIGNQEVEFILVRGGTFLMGYDGKNSLYYNSEPVHKVNLSSYYISKECVKNSVAHDLGFKIDIEKHGDWSYVFRNSKTLDQFIEKIKTIPHIKVCTEAQWEYAVRQPELGLIYHWREACSDLFVERYSDTESTNPEVTVSQDKRHVFRQFRNDEWIYSRFHFSCVDCFVRLAIAAEDINDL